MTMTQPTAIKRYKHTDDGNALRFVAAYRDRIIYVPEHKSWYIWDGTRWVRDSQGIVFEMVRKTAREMILDAVHLNLDEAQALTAWSHKSESEQRLGACERLARSDADVVVPADRLDAEPWLLNTPNCTIDLRTGEALAHDQRHYITKITKTGYYPEDIDQQWEEFLNTTMEHDSSMTSFLRRAAGCSLVGVPQDEVLFFVHGKAATGKSTFMEALKNVLGSYAATAQFESFVGEIRTSSAASGDIARLAGARLVASIEVDQGAKLAAGLVKGITGRDTIAARELYKPEFEFRPQLTLWLVANDAPKIDAGDSGLWRRILEIPFTNVIPQKQRDPSLKTHFLDDPAAMSAILAWAVRGCNEWREHGLNPPEKVLQATERYQLTQNPVWHFVQDCCEFADDAEVLTAELISAYRDWYEGPERYALSDNGLAKAISKLPGVEDYQQKAGMRLRMKGGIRLKKQASDAV